MKIEILWSVAALEQLRAITSQRLALRVLRHITALEEFPELGRRLPGGRFLLTVKGCRIVYRRTRIDAVTLVALDFRPQRR